MRKLIFVAAMCFMCQSVFAQAPSMEEKYYYTCKIWGFVKYYHSDVSVCNVNWDSVLMAVLPGVQTAANSTQFNDALMDMLNAAGPMALSSSYFPDTLSTELKRNRDFGWFSSPVLRPDVKTILDTIKNNFRPHPNCWVNYSSSSLTGPCSYLTFGADSIMLDMNTYDTYPSQDERLLMLFKYWNIIRYFNPYNYVSDVPWDTVLHNYSVQIADASSANALLLLVEKMSAALDDAHTEGMTYSSEIQSLPGFYRPRLILKYLEGRYVVVKSGIAGIVSGDALVFIDGKTPAQWEDSLRPYCSAGNIAVFKRTMCETFLGRLAPGTAINLVVEDSTGTNNVFSVTCVWPPSAPAFFYDPFYGNDSLSSIHWKSINCDIGYVNMANLEIGEESAMYAALKDKTAIIFDLRNGALGAAWSIAQLLYPASTPVVTFSVPEVDYPGTFYWADQYIGIHNPDSYPGKVIFLIDENTQSHSEWSSMAMGAGADVVKVGSQTAGTDGDITRVRLSQDIYSGFTSLGTYYPNLDSTQRIGIVPDSLVTHTRLSVRRKRDNVLEAALFVAGCDVYLGTENALRETPTVSLYPNPAGDAVTIIVTGIANQHIPVTITNIMGKVLLQKTISSTASKIGIQMLPPGMYLVTLKTESGNFVTKLVKE